jgi:hypothetical protein
MAKPISTIGLGALELESAGSVELTSDFAAELWLSVKASPQIEQNCVPSGKPVPQLLQFNLNTSFLFDKQSECPCPIHPVHSRSPPDYKPR